MTLLATRTAVRLVRFTPETSRATEMLDAMQRAAGRSGVDLISARSSTVAPWLLLWGPGAPDRLAPMRQQLAAGGHVIALDLAYWQRETKVRVSIDAAHPQAWVLRRDWPTSRFDRAGVAVRDRWNPTGPVIVAGLGRKARVQYGEAAVLAWESDMIRACATRWPMRPVHYRRKQADAPLPLGASLASDAPIEQVLDGASLVITWHSNVAVDAIRLGVPVVCRDGAAAAVYPAGLDTADPAPIPVALRDRFLANLAWFQWAPSEASACWAWLQEVLACES